ncbi:MAG TPA: Holliday junction resolvase RuvX [Solirubrobacteraceae bacterium]|nr:Holliday junction resolvase RuvX [Solirubrobacteraceae bacterium]
MRRVLGLDYGSARCGCAIADPTGTLVTPLAAIESPAQRRGLEAIVALVAERDVGRVVVGLPLALDGHDTEQTRETRRFAGRLARRLGEVPVVLHDERLTTRLAQRSAHETGGAAAAEDSRAAAHMLESWLAACADAETHSPAAPEPAAPDRARSPHTSI